jgi:hypothetical protein
MNFKNLGLFVLAVMFLSSIQANAEQTMRDYVNQRVAEICHAPHAVKITTAQLVKMLQNSKRKTSCSVYSITPYTNPTQAKASCVDGYCGGLVDIQLVSGEGANTQGGDITLRNNQKLCAVQDGHKISVAYHVDAEEKPTGTILNHVTRFLRGWMYDENGTIFEFSNGGLDDVTNYNYYDNYMNWSSPPDSSTAYECGQLN